MSESSFNEKRMVSQSALKSQQKEQIVASTQKKAGFLSPRDRIKARNAQLEKDYQEFNNESRLSRGFNKRDDTIDSINISPSAKDF